MVPVAEAAASAVAAAVAVAFASSVEHCNPLPSWVRSATDLPGATRQCIHAILQKGRWGEFLRRHDQPWPSCAVEDAVEDSLSGHPRPSPDRDRRRRSSQLARSPWVGAVGARQPSGHPGRRSGGLPPLRFDRRRNTVHAGEALRRPLPKCVSEETLAEAWPRTPAFPSHRVARRTCGSSRCTSS